jgi:Glyoxalase/Bleomycin resistance protein/Dioxygenase superfamily
VTTLGFGVPVGAIFQYAYVVDDIHRAMGDYVERLGLGPWSLRDRFSPPTARLRGQPHSPTFSLARSFSGNTMVELIQQHDDGPSVFHEGAGPRRYGFHHWGVVSATFEDDLARHEAQGYPEAFYDELPSGSRVAYVDATRDFPGMIELVEYSEAQDHFYTSIYEATLDWDGTSPVRKEN